MCVLCVLVMERAGCGHDVAHMYVSAYTDTQDKCTFLNNAFNTSALRFPKMRWHLMWVNHNPPHWGVQPFSCIEVLSSDALHATYVMHNVSVFQWHVEERLKKPLVLLLLVLYSWLHHVHLTWVQVWHTQQQLMCHCRLMHGWGNSKGYMYTSVTLCKIKPKSSAADTLEDILHNSYICNLKTA